MNYIKMETGKQIYGNNFVLANRVFFFFSFFCFGQIHEYQAFSLICLQGLLLVVLVEVL